MDWQTAIKMKIDVNDKKFRELSNAIPHVVWTANSSAELDYLNEVWTEITGAPSEAGLGKGWHDFVHPDDLKNIQKLENAMRRGEAVKDLEYRLRTKDGTYRWALMRQTPARDGSGNVVRWYGTTTEIHRLRETQDHLNLVLESAQMGTWHVDLKTNRVTSSPGLAAILGIPEQAENIFELIDELMHPDDREEVNRVWHDSVARHVPYSHEYRIIRPDGSIRWIFVRGKTTRGPDGNPLFIAGIAADITERKEAHEALKKSEKHLKLALQAGRLGTWQADLKTQKLTGSVHFAALHGISSVPDTLEMAIVSLVHPDDRAELSRAINDAINNRSSFSRQYRIVRPDGETRWLQARGDIVKDESGADRYLLGVVSDVSDQVRGHQEVLKILNTLPQIVWMANENGEIHFLSRQWKQFTGLTLEEGGYGKQFEKVMHPDDLIPNKLAVQDAKKRKGPVSLIHRIRTPNGQYRWVYAKGNSSFDDYGKLTGWIGVTIDIHEQKQREAQLRETQEQLNLALTSAKMGTWHIDLKTGKVAYSDGLKALLGFPNIDRPVLDVIASLTLPEDRDEINRVWQEAVRKREPYSHEFRVIRPDGAIRWMLSRGTVKIGEGGEPEYFSGIAADITERKEAAEALKQSEARFREITNALPQIVWTADERFYIDWYNDWWFKYLDLPRGTKWDDPVTQPMHPEDVERTRPRLKEAVETGKDFLMEQRFRRGSDGQYRWHLVRGVPIRDSSGKIVKWIGANTDIHDQKMLLNRLEEERELRETFVATLTHDLRTPLTAAKMGAQMLNRRGGDPNFLHKGTSRIIDNIDRADRMIRDLLDTNRISAGEGLPIDLDNCDIREIAEDAIEELASIHGDRFIIDAPEPVEGRLSCGGIRRILENLCANAIKYGANDRSVTVSIRKLGKEGQIKVHNYGQPIAPEDQKTLFDPFRRSAHAQRSGQRGWGLGLTLVKGLAEAHGGRVGVESDAEKGTTFFVMLPLDARSVAA